MSTVADQFAATLAAAGVKRIYGVVGDSLNGLTDRRGEEASSGTGEAVLRVDMLPVFVSMTQGRESPCAQSCRHSFVMIGSPPCWSSLHRLALSSGNHVLQRERYGRRVENPC
jgi:hypothetical protein